MALAGALFKWRLSDRTPAILGAEPENEIGFRGRKPLKKLIFWIKRMVKGRSKFCK